MELSEPRLLSLRAVPKAHVVAVSVSFRRQNPRDPRPTLLTFPLPLPLPLPLQFLRPSAVSALRNGNRSHHREIIYAESATVRAPYRRARG